MSNVLITNKIDGNRCLTQHGGDNDWSWWDGYKFLGCDINNNNQKVSFNDQGKYYQIQTNGAEMFISRQNLDLHSQPYDVRHSFVGDWNNNSDGKSDQFGIQGIEKNQGRSGLDAVNNGPFQFGSLYYGGYKIDVDGDVLRNYESNSSKDSQKWIQYDLYKKCQERGIPFDGCIASELNSCSLQFNKDKFDTCPSDYCQNSNNVDKTECKNWCNQNVGACDDAVVKFCEANPENTELCGCINTGEYDKLRDKLAEKGSTLIPICHIKECVDAKAYKPQNIRGLECPDQQICLQGVDIEALGTSNTKLENVNFECNVSLEKPAAPAPSIQSKTNTDVQQTHPTFDQQVNNFFSRPQNIYALAILMGIFFFFIIFIKIIF